MRTGFLAERSERIFEPQVGHGISMVGRSTRTRAALRVIPAPSAGRFWHRCSYVLGPRGERVLLADGENEPQTGVSAPRHWEKVFWSVRKLRSVAHVLTHVNCGRWQPSGILSNGTCRPSRLPAGLTVPIQAPGGSAHCRCCGHARPAVWLGHGVYGCSCPQSWR